MLVAEGQDLPNRLLFDEYIYTLKPLTKLTVRSSELRKTGEEPKFRLHLQGRTDLVILVPGKEALIRQNVGIAIEVKPEGFNVDVGLREAFIQLVGLNVSNAVSSPLVILTNLAKTHYVLYFESVEALPNRYEVVVKKYGKFSNALHHACSIYSRSSITRNLSMPPTPEESVDSDVDEDDELAQNFGSVSVEGTVA